MEVVPHESSPMRKGKSVRATEELTARFPPKEMQGVNALALERPSDQPLRLDPRLQRRNVQRPGVNAAPVQRRPSLAHQEEESTDEEPLVPTYRDRTLQVLVNWSRLMHRYLWLMIHSARGRMFEKWDETRYENAASQVQFAAPTPKRTCKQKAKRAERRDDLCYIGRALPPNNGKGRKNPFMSTPELCRGPDGIPHRAFLKATGGQRGNGTKTFSWMCENCGARFERTDIHNATDGEGSVQGHQSAAGPILPRSAAADRQAQALASSSTIRPLEQHLATLPPQDAARYLQAVQTAVIQRDNPEMFNLAEDGDEMIDEGQVPTSVNQSTFPDAEPSQFDPDL